jgi:putative oxidoreductase
MIDMPLISPQLSQLYETLAPFAYALLRVIVGLALVPHGLRNTVGCFPNPGLPTNLKELAATLERNGYRPGRLWARAISVTELVGGPLLAVGLFTRPVAVAILIFLLVTDIERWRVGRYFWDQLGMEYTLMWTIAVFYVLVQGGGVYSLDHWLGY